MADIPQSLDAMQKTLNFVLIEVGKVFQKSKRDGKTAPPTNMRVQTAIPTLTDRFHYTLDDIEYEILQAKAVLLHDLKEIQAKKAAAIKPKLEPIPTPAQSPEKPAEQTSASGVDFGVGTSQAQVKGDVDSGTTLDRLQKSIGEVQKIVRSPNTAGNEVPATKSQGDLSNQILPNESLFESPTETNNQAGTSSADESKKLDHTPKEETSKDNTQGAELSKTSTEAPNTVPQTNATDIDSLFGGDDSNPNTNESQNADFADIDFTAGDDFTFPATTAPANTDLDSLMPGIGSYAAVSQSEDFNMLDFSNNTDAANGNGNTGGDTAMDAMLDLSNDNNAGSGDNGGNSSNNNDMGMNTESNFDDLLDGMDFGDADDGLGGGDMEHGEFDDAFFGLT